MLKMLIFTLTTAALLGSISTAALAIPEATDPLLSLRQTQSSSDPLHPQDRVTITEYMHQLGYATVMGIEVVDQTLVVNTVDLDGPLAVVLDPNNGQVLNTYRMDPTLDQPVTAQAVSQPPTLQAFLDQSQSITISAQGSLEPQLDSSPFSADQNAPTLSPLVLAQW